MSEAVWKSAKFFAGGYDFSTKLNALAIDYSAETPEKTAMGDLNKTRLPGLKDVGFSLNGHTDSINPDKWFWDNMSLSQTPMTMAETGLVGTQAYLFQPNIASYSPGGKVGDVYAFSLKGSGNGQLIRGTILYPKTTKTSSDVGTAKELGAVVSSRIGTWSINAAGSGYSLADIITVVQGGGSGGTLIVTKIGGGGQVQGAVLLTPGAGYAKATALVTTVAPSGGTGFKVNIVSLNPATHLHAMLHVFAASAGDTLDVIIQSDTSSGMSSPMTALTFVQVAAIGSQYLTAAAPIADTFYRVSFTIAGNGSESFTFAVSVGIF